MLRRFSVLRAKNVGSYLIEDIKGKTSILLLCSDIPWVFIEEFIRSNYLVGRKLKPVLRGQIDWYLNFRAAS